MSLMDEGARTAFGPRIGARTIPSMPTPPACASDSRFARVLLQQPEIAMLDEPFGQLDPEGFSLVEHVRRP